MKKQFLIIPIVAMTLCACGGGTTTTSQQSLSSDGNDASDNTVQTEDSAQLAASKDPFLTNKERVVYNILKNFTERNPPLLSKERFKEIDDNFKEWGIESHWNNNCVDLDDIEVNCLYLKKGGYYVMALTDGYSDNPKRLTFFYENGNLKEVPKSEFIPQPTISELYANADKFPKKAFEIIDNEIKNGSSYVYRNGILSVMFDPGTRTEEDEYMLPAPLKGLKAKENNGLIFPVAHYEWDGERFVRFTDDKPLEEDLSLLEQPALTPCTEKVLYDVLALISKKNNGRFDRQNIMVADNLSDNSHLSFTTDDGGDGAAGHDLSCFPLSDGGFFVLFGSCNYTITEYSTYVYNGGSLQKVDKYKHLPKLDIGDFFPNPDKFSKAAQTVIKKKIETVPTYLYDKGVLKIGFDPHDFEEGEPYIPGALQSYSEFSGDDYYVMMPAPFQWDGEKMTRQ